jgi:hypothetical protein
MNDQLIFKLFMCVLNLVGRRLELSPDSFFLKKTKTRQTACSFGWWLMAGADLFWEKSTAAWLLVAGLFFEKDTAGWWLISQTNRAFVLNSTDQALWTQANGNSTQLQHLSPVWNSNRGQKSSTMGGWEPAASVQNITVRRRRVSGGGHRGPCPSPAAPMQARERRVARTRRHPVGY